ncbi:hypothetical protein BBJ28_00013422 [Nothophytophthora sp. Chile5]|nr:hypothetical protein BBJ28_00013422 [Nothophytophthora sp. Chile5]
MKDEDITPAFFRDDSVGGLKSTRRARRRASPIGKASARGPDLGSRTDRRKGDVDERMDAFLEDEAGLSAVELRRKRNREAMQRTRRRERDELAVMRRDIGVLERQYRDALQLQAARFHAPSSRLHSQRQSPEGPGRGDHQRFCEYRQMAGVSKELQRENFVLQQTLEAKRKAYERLERVLADYHLEKSDVSGNEGDGMDGLPTSNHRTGDSANAASLDYEPITEKQATALMVQCAQDIASFERMPVPTTRVPLSGCFGWSIKQQIVDQSNVRFLLSKTVHNVHACAAAEKAWVLYQSLESNNVSRPIRVVRFEKLQVVDENTHVVARDIVHPLHQGVVMRSLFLRFRMHTPTGFVVARACMNPSSPARQPRSGLASGGWSQLAVPKTYGERREVRYADLTTWLQFDRLDPQNPEKPGCLVKFGGYCDYGTTHDLSERFVSVLLAVVHMENRVLGPLVPLLG